MIKLTRSEKPIILKSNEHRWTQDLMSAVAKYGSYKQIPEKEKKGLVSYYRHDDIKEALIISSFEKCSFCEGKPSESGNVEVEHFKPKSIYPEYTFKWSNLLPSCTKCNGSKRNHDTGSEPIVNPYEINPETIFYYQDIKLKVRNSQNFEMGTQTIKVCGLNSIRLLKPRADILVSLHSFSDSIEEAIEEYQEADTSQKKISRLRKINEAIEKIEILTSPKEKYSGFCKFFLDNCEPYKKAKELTSTLID